MDMGNPDGTGNLQITSIKHRRRARVLLPDELMRSSPLRGTFNRDGKEVFVYFTDAVFNGDMNFVA